MGGIKHQRNIDEVRKRLYDRSRAPEQTRRHDLGAVQAERTREAADGAAAPKREWDAWDVPQERTPGKTTDLRSSLSQQAAAVSAPPADTAVPPGTTGGVPPGTPPGTAARAAATGGQPGRSERAPVRRVYRLFVLGVSLFLFVLAVAISSAYLYFGGNQISARNIGISINGPFAVAGGEVLPLQVGITNENTVPIQSATLIIDYPDGTRSVGEGSRELFEERLPIGDIAVGETENVPVRIALFGEENQQKEITATIEYRVAGSNGTFYKDAEPLSVRINSSPLVIRVSAIDTVSSGQEVDVELSVQSNSSNPIENLLINAAYPSTFSFVGAEPSPDFSSNSWLIEELEPRETETITISGTIAGFTNEDIGLEFVAGSPGAENPYTMSSVLAEARHEFIIEQPFLSVESDINGYTDETAVLPARERATVGITVVNTLPETIYDLSIEAKLDGNVIADEDIRTTNGFYDDSTDTLRWEVSGMRDFDRLLPGAERFVTFQVIPNDRRATAFLTLDTEVYARRVNEPSAEEKLVGEDAMEVRYSSEPSLASEAAHDTGPFDDSGPIPPVPGEETTYTLTLAATAGANDLTGALVSTQLPQHIEWLDAVEGTGSVEYNTVSQQLRWQVGDIEANQTETTSFQVSFTPSVLQAGRTPSLVDRQELRGTDAYTGATLRTTAPAVTTELSTEAGYQEGNGIVLDPND